MTKATMIWLSRRYALMFGMGYDTHAWRRQKKELVERELANFVAMGRMAVGKLKNHADESKLQELLSESRSIGLCS